MYTSVQGTCTTPPSAGGRAARELLGRPATGELLRSRVVGFLNLCLR
eukprot:COSAG02_NODE_4336_length_5489_cov_5.862894_1_plen_46_part_10